MTTGSDLQDLRTFASTGCGNGLVGTYWSRTWSGGDNPSIGTASSPPSVNPQLGVYSSRRPLKRSRSNGEHGYTMNLESRQDPLGEWSSNSGLSWFTGSVMICFGGASFDYSSWTVNDDLTLIGKLREAIIGSDFNPAVSLAEGKESLQTIAKAADAIAGMIYHAKRKDFKAAAKSLAQYNRSNRTKPGKAAANVAENNLNLQYGIKPILNDVYNAATTLAHLTSAPAQDVITVTLKKPGTVTSAAPTAVSYKGWCWKAKKIKYIRREVDTTKLIGLTDPAQVAWEVLPYSFVVDWFIPIGDFLQARGVSNSLTGTFVTTTVTKGFVGTPTPVSPNLRIRGDMSRYHRRQVSVLRDVSSTLNVPIPTIKPLSEWANWRHARDAVSLLVTGLKKSKEVEYTE